MDLRRKFLVLVLVGWLGSVGAVDARTEAESITVDPNTIYDIQYKINDQAWSTLSSVRIVRIVEYGGKFFLETRKPYTGSSETSFLLLDSVVSLLAANTPTQAA